MESKQVTQESIVWFLNNGLAVALIIAFLYGSWRIILWSGKNVVLPLRDAAVTHLANVDSTLRSVSNSLTAIDEKLTSVETKTTAVLDSHEGARTRINELDHRITVLEQKL